MTSTRVILLVGTALAAACSAAPYQPQEYELKDVPMGKFDVTGEVTVENMQADRSIHSLRGFAPPLQGDYATITQAVVDQVRKEIDKDGARLKTGAHKVIRIAVTDLNTSARASTYMSWLDVAVGLGDAPPAMIEVHTETGFFATLGYHAYDHALAYAALEILKNEDVRKYLAQDGARPPKLHVPVFEAAKAPAAASKPAGGSGPEAKGTTEKLKELKSMLDQGLITQEQYDKKRQDILDSM